MKLKKFVGKTIKAAKKSVQQISGPPHASQLNEILPASNNNSGKESRGNKEKSAGKDTQKVRFERSENTKPAKDSSEIDKNLESIRKYAFEQLSSKVPIRHDSEKPDTEEKQESQESFSEILDSTQEQSSAPLANNVYSRKSIRPKKEKEADITLDSTEETPSQEEPAEEVTYERSESPTDEKTVSADPVIQRELDRLHSRLDELEQKVQRLEAEGNSDNTTKTVRSFESHPDFSRFLQAGINEKIVRQWFKDIENHGLDPFDHQEAFRSRLANTLLDTLDKPAHEETKKFVLFTGPPGAGKTRMIMKLSQHPYFMLEKDIALASVIPAHHKETDHRFYSIQESFCKDKQLPCYKISNKDELPELIEEWEPYEHVLIDTPALPSDGEGALQQYNQLRHLFEDLPSLELHYLVNASHNDVDTKGLFSTNNPVDIDYLAITHLDMTTNWGSIVELLMQTSSPLRYISVGQTIPDSLSRFNAKWFTQKMLQNIWNN